MSYRATYITEFLYRNGQDKEMIEIKEILEKYCCSIIWHGRKGYDGVGYFHGIIKGLYDGQTEKDEKVIKKELKKYRVRIKIVHE